MAATALRAGVLLLLGVLLLVYISSVEGQFSPVAVTTGFESRRAGATFEWAGAIWVAGGNAGFGQERTSVWGSFDLGRTWAQPTVGGNAVTLPGYCDSDSGKGLIYHNSVYLVCGFDHDYYGPEANSYQTFVSTDQGLTSWTVLQDGCEQCTGFSVDRMAVPFDGVGTLIMVNSQTSTDVWWQSATGNFQAPRGTGAVNVWTQFAIGGSNYATPWSPRYLSATTTDAEGLVMVMGGGMDLTTGAALNDVWQLSWASDASAPLAYQLTANAPWTQRAAFPMYRVHDWLFIYGGGAYTNFGVSDTFDDAWMSIDYGTTWTLFQSAVTGTPRLAVDPLVVSRRMFIVGGATTSNQALSDVWVAYW